MILLKLFAVYVAEVALTFLATGKRSFDSLDVSYAPGELTTLTTYSLNAVESVN